MLADFLPRAALDLCALSPTPGGCGPSRARLCGRKEPGGEREAGQCPRKKGSDRSHRERKAAVLQIGVALAIPAVLPKKPWSDSPLFATAGGSDLSVMPSRAIGLIRMIHAVSKDGKRKKILKDVSEKKKTEVQLPAAGFPTKSTLCCHHLRFSFPLRFMQEPFLGRAEIH